MLGHFPRPHDDELLFNIVARMCERIGYLDFRGLGEDVFNSRAATAVSDLPHRLLALVERISLEFEISTAILIDEHTLWPFHAAFHTPERREISKAEMLRTGHPYLRLGLMAVRAPWPRFFRFCASCVIADRQSLYKETYWHRMHQIPGIDVCGVHQERLRDSTVSFRQPRNRFEYLSAEHPGVLPAGTVRSSELRPVSKVEVNLANGAAWLLEHPTATRSGLDLRDRYLWELALRGYATWSGQLRPSQLKASIVERYSSAWLSRIGCGFENAHESWIERLFRKPIAPQFTVRHLLLADFLDLSVERIICSAIPLPFGPSPWPCLNHASGHYCEEAVQNCEVTATRNGASLMGRFSCPVCGMTYIRLGPDSLADDRSRRDWIPTYGPVWDDRLVTLWNNPSISLRELSRDLGVDPWTAQLQAARLQLNPVRPGSHHTAPSAQANVGTTGPRRSVLSYQAQWLSLRASNPAASRTELRRAAPKIYAFLRRHARAWLDEQSPLARHPRKVQRQVNWSERDALITREVVKATERLRQSVPPVRLTRTALLREAGFIWAMQKLSFLSSTQAILKSLVETRSDFAVRRILFVKSTCEKDNEHVPKWLLIRRAGIRSDLIADKYVGAALSRALAHIGTKTVSEEQREERAYAAGAGT